MARTQDETNVIINSVAIAANNASIAAKNASEAALSASTNAQIAAKAAADSATAIAVVATDTSWMKRSLLGIEETLNRIKNDFPTRQEHNDLVTEINDHENRLRLIEARMWKWLGIASVVSAIVGLIVAYLMKLIGQ